MPLPRQNIPVPFAQGADTKTDSFLLPPGKLTTLQNGYLTKSGTICKRPGHASLGNATSTGGTITAGQGIAAYRGELVVMDATALYSYAPSLASFKSKGSLRSAAVTMRRVVRSTGNYTQQDQATNTTTGLQLVTYYDGTHIRYSIVDTATGQVLVDRQRIDSVNNTTSCKTMSCGTRLVAIYNDTTNAKLKMVAFSGTSAAAAVDIAGASFLSATGYFDACILPGLSGSADTLAIAWNSTDGGGGIRARGYNATTMVALGGTLTVLTGFAASNGIAIIPDTAGSTQRFIISYATAAAVRVISITSTFAAGGGIADQQIVALAGVASVVGASFNTSTSTGRIYWTPWNANHQTDSVAYATWSGNTVTSAGTYVKGHSLFGKPFVQNSEMFIPVAYDPDNTGTGYIGQQPTYLVIGDSGAQVARLLARVGNGRAKIGILPESQSVGTGQWVLPLMERDLLTTVPASPNLNAPLAAGSLPSYVYTTAGITCATLKFFDAQDSYSTAELADSLHVSGGQLMQYDGTQVVEHGFNVYPEGMTVTTSGAGKNLSAGSYVYYGVYEWTDAQGRVHQSAPSPGVQVTATAGQQGNITFPTYRVGAKASNVTLVVYRTIANNFIPYRLTTASAPVANSTTVDTIAITDDTVTDAQITAAPTLYTLGNVASNLPLGPCKGLTLFKNRICGIQSEDPLSVAYSKEVLPGAPLEFTPDEQYIRADPIGGALTALGVIDDKLILFKENRILFSSGDGPDPTGAGGGFSTPALVTTDCGCTDPRSVTVTPDGLMFRGKKGIYLINRGLSVSYVGAPVENVLADNTVVSGVLSPTLQQVRFGLSDNLTVLVYDYMNQQWGWHLSPALASVGGCLYSGRYTYLRPDGITGQEDPTIFTDFGSFYQLVVETGWFNLAELNGFVRLYEVALLARYKSAHRLRFSIAFDNAESYLQTGDVVSTNAGTWGGTQTATWGDTPPTTWGGPNPTLTVRFDPATQKCSSFRLRLEDYPVDTNYGESLALTGMTLLIGGKVGLRKLPSSLQVGVSS